MGKKLKNVPNMPAVNNTPAQARKCAQLIFSGNFSDLGCCLYLKAVIKPPRNNKTGNA